MKIEKYQSMMKDGKTYLFKSGDGTDAQNLYDLRKLTAGETNFLTRYPEEIPNTSENERKSLVSADESEFEIFLLAYDGARLAGAAHISPICKHMKFRHRAEIGVMVAKDYWACGLGKKLMTDSFNYAKDMGYTQIELSTFVKNERAIGLYEYLGFKRVGVVPSGAILKDGTVLEELKMYLDISEL